MCCCNLLFHKKFFERKVKHMAVILGTILIILMIVIGEERGVAGVFVLAGNMI